VKDERGTATLELAVVAPTLMLLILGVLQFGLWHHGQHVVTTAALEAARTAAAEDGSAGAGEARALQLIAHGLGAAARDPGASVSLDGGAARASVTATLDGLLPIPGLDSFSLHSEASVFRERFRPANEE
jgi:Flp pilus assembly protein TadG